MFGNVACSLVATLGLNPSNREFVDAFGNELSGQARRLETLASLGLARWADASERDIRCIVKGCERYFSRNPYDLWFKKLDVLISATRASYYYGTASHLDLIPFATSRKWSSLSRKQRYLLLQVSGNTFAHLLKESPVRLLILNGTAVVSNFCESFSIFLERQIMSEWTLRSRSRNTVPGLAYSGRIRKLGGVVLKRDVQVLGFNHNIQSSFGITRDVASSMRRWIGQSSERVLGEA